MMIRSLLILALLLGTSATAQAGLLWRICGAPMRWLGLVRDDASGPVLARLVSINKGRILGAGGYGVVYEGTGRALGETEPVRIILKTHNTPTVAPPEKVAEAERELLTEATTYNRVHPGEVVTTRIDGKLTMVQLEFPAAAGKKQPANDLSHLIESDRSAAFRRRVSDSALGELELIHDRKIVHNDIKPSNLLANEAGVVRIIDYGIAKDRGAELPTGKGTLSYLSPRRWNGAKDVQPSDDVFAMGLTLLEFEMGKKMADLKDYTMTRKFVFHEFSAWKRVPDNVPSIIAPERAMAHLTSAKKSVADYRRLLAAAENPATFRSEFAKQWVAAYKAEASPALRDQLIYELFLAPKLGPDLVKAIPEARIREAILERGREMKDKVEREAIWFGWHDEMKPMIEEFLKAF